jgi:hypothetical protein
MSSRREYLNWGKVQALPAAKYGVTVTGYDRGIFWVSPNPQDKRRASEAESQYAQGMYISKQTKTISQEEFDNPENWN